MPISAKNLGRAILPWVITALTLGYVFGYAIDWKAIPEATAGADLPLFIAITVFDKIVFFCVWAYTQALTIRRFVEPVAYRKVFSVKAGSELFRAVNNSLADATFLLGISQIVKSGMTAVVAVVSIPFGAHFAVLLMQITLCLPLLSGGWSENRDVAITVVVCWILVIIGWVAVRRGHLRRLLADAGMGGWVDKVSPRDFVPFLGYFTLFAIFDVLIQGTASRAFGVDISWTALTARIPILYFALSVPSLANFGTRELAWANLFSEFGTREELTAFALWTNVIFLVMHVAIGALFIGRAMSLIHELREARKEGEEIPRPLFRDSLDP